ncbi:MAG: 1,4-alpha-glucan-branching enzyme, partial [Alistipes sp.]
MGNPVQRLPIVECDAWLQPVEEELNRRYKLYTDHLEAICHAAGSLIDYANGYRYYGWQRDEDLSGWWFREWLPGAQDVYLFGDFNGWQRTQYRLDKDRAGVWSGFFP